MCISSTEKYHNSVEEHTFCMLRGSASAPQLDVLRGKMLGRNLPWDPGELLPDPVGYGQYGRRWTNSLTAWSNLSCSFGKHHSKHVWQGNLASCHDCSAFWKHGIGWALSICDTFLKIIHNSSSILIQNNCKIWDPPAVDKIIKSLTNNNMHSFLWFPKFMYIKFHPAMFSRVS